MSVDEPKLRRRVKTGEWIRKRYRSQTVDSVQYHYGRRIVCRRCARYCDNRDAREYIIRHLAPVFVLLSLIGLLLMLSPLGRL